MKHINELNLKHAFIINDKFIAIKANKRNVLKVRSKYFSNYPLWINSAYKVFLDNGKLHCIYEYNRYMTALAEAEYKECFIEGA